MECRLKLGIYLLVSVLFAAQSNASQRLEGQVKGRWVTGDVHIHSALSADAKSSLEKILYQGFNQFDLDYMVFSNHLRNNSRDNTGNPEVSHLYSYSLENFEIPAIQLYQKKHPNKLLLSSFEWDVPTHDHMNVGIFLPPDSQQSKVQVSRYFEYRFGSKNTLNDFTLEQRSAFKQSGISRQNTSHADAVKALAWLQQNYPEHSYIMLNHPTRYAHSYSIQQIREFNDVAPDVFVLLEGMVGNQFNGERGDYGRASRGGLLGGVDPFVAEVGGNWDALLGEGRHVWNMANSDHHFKIALPYASGYFPGEYAKTYLYVPDISPLSMDKFKWLAALKSGNSFAVYGDLINELNFNLVGKNAQATMGQTLILNKKQMLTINVGFKQPDMNNREVKVGDEVYRGKVPVLHHIDLIAGDVTERARPGTVAYAYQRNHTTRVIRSFTAKDWQCDEQGYCSMTYDFKANRNQYFRLRGTHLSYEQAGLTKNGEPQRSARIMIDREGSRAYYQRINERNYNDLWFYSNPIFIKVNNNG